MTAPHDDAPEPETDWRQTVGALWDEVARMREEHDAARRRRGRPPTTNKEIADAVGISDRTLGDWLRKRSVVPDWYEIRKIVEYLEGDATSWQPRWERARAAYDNRPRGRTARARNSHDGAGVPEQEDGPTGVHGDILRTGSPARTEPGGVAGHSVRGRRRVPAMIAVVVAVAAAVAIVVWAVTDHGDPRTAATPTTSPSPSVRVWHATIVNTWSDKRSKDVGVYRYKSPLRAEWELPGYLSGNVISIVCQHRHGRRVTDDRTNESSAVWDRTIDGSWVPDLYTDLPKVPGENPPLSIPPCANVS